MSLLNKITAKAIFLFAFAFDTTTPPEIKAALKLQIFEALKKRL